MKAQPSILVYGLGYQACSVEEATHLRMYLPGPTGPLVLPVMRQGTRQGTGNWTWNGSTEAPTLRPSVLTTSHRFTCHSFINDGKVQFLGDCSHELRGQTVDLLDVPPDPNK